jgi:hypothetical protein
MMKIFEGEKSFALDVLDYEFPGAQEYYDANWLNVKIEASDESYAWIATDSCLLTTELKELCAWLRSLDDNSEEELLLEFMEGELKFKHDPAEELLKVILDFSFHPKGEKFVYGDGGDSEYEMCFHTEKFKRNGLIKSLEKLLGAFPVRGSL